MAAGGDFETWDGQRWSGAPPGDWHQSSDDGRWWPPAWNSHRLEAEQHIGSGKTPPALAGNWPRAVGTTTNRRVDPLATDSPSPAPQATTRHTEEPKRVLPVEQRGGERQAAAPTPPVLRGSPRVAPTASAPMPPPAIPAAPLTEMTTIDRLRLACVGAAVLAAIGSVTPWATITTVFGTATISGTNGDGLVTLFLAIAAGGAIALGHEKRASWWATAAILGIVGAVGAYDAVTITDTAASTDSEYVTASVGYGVVLVAASGLAGAVVAVAGASRLDE